MISAVGNFLTQVDAMTQCVCQFALAMPNGAGTHDFVRVFLPFLSSLRQLASWRLKLWRQRLGRNDASDAKPYERSCARLRVSSRLLCLSVQWIGGSISGTFHSPDRRPSK